MDIICTSEQRRRERIIGGTTKYKLILGNYSGNWVLFFHLAIDSRLKKIHKGDKERTRRESKSFSPHDTH